MIITAESPERKCQRMALEYAFFNRINQIFMRIDLSMSRIADRERKGQLQGY